MKFILYFAKNANRDIMYDYKSATRHLEGQMKVINIVTWIY